MRRPRSSSNNPSTCFVLNSTTLTAPCGSVPISSLRSSPASSRVTALAALVATHTRMSLAGGERESEGRQLLAQLFASGQEQGDVRTDVSPRRLTEHYLACNLTALCGWIADQDASTSLDEQLSTSLALFWSGAETERTTTRRRRPTAKRRAAPQSS